MTECPVHPHDWLPWWEPQRPHFSPARVTRCAHYGDGAVVEWRGEKPRQVYFAQWSKLSTLRGFWGHYPGANGDTEAEWERHVRALMEAGSE